MTKSKETFSEACAWCGGLLGLNAHGYPCFATLKSEPKIRGTFVWVIPNSAGKTVHGLITTGDSEAKRGGIDLVMMCCSENCKSELTGAMTLGFTVHEMVRHEVIGYGEPSTPDHGMN